MSKIEKTLELNLVHEILSLADSFWWHLGNNSIKRYWSPYIKIPWLHQTLTFSKGLPISLEGKRGGGYDVCIESQSGFLFNDPRLLFLQFKAGVERQFSRNPKSIFHKQRNRGSHKHIVFEFNNNKNFNQHIILRQLSSSIKAKDAVLYVFPRITNCNQLVSNIGNLLHMTSFVSVAELDKQASDNKVIISSGDLHKYRVCWNDPSRCEVNFFFFFFFIPESIGVLCEILSIRMYRALQLLRTIIRNDSDVVISKTEIANAMFKHLLYISDFLAVSHDETVSELLKYDVFQDKVEVSSKSTDNSESSNVILARRRFSDVKESFESYIQWICNLDTFHKDTEIPKPPKRYSICIEDHSQRIGLGCKDFDPCDFRGIDYQII